jgi:N-methylhydantoinase A
MTAKIRNPQSAIRIGVDTGGTFTDFVYHAGGGLRLFKIASTPDDPSRAILEGLRRIAAETGAGLSALEVIHGTTVGTNALLQRRGARIALITTAGFEDVLAIGRQARPELYNLNVTRPAPLAPDELRFGVQERVTASGEVLQALDEQDLNALVETVKRAGAEAVAVCLLFGFTRPEHEQRIAQALQKLNLPLSVAHQILPEYREYERASTVCVNAYLQPIMGRYLLRLEEGKRRRGEEETKSPPENAKRFSPSPPLPFSSSSLRVMQSSGGGISASAAIAEPVRTILSGPAGGVVGARRAARGANIITFDMGGTSTDVALCDARGLRMTRESVVAGMPVAVPMLDIHTVGAGGGSIAYVDAGGSLRVGPESAGADPGPACYGRGVLPTVTDANCVLGRFGGAVLLGGEFKLDEPRAREVLSQLAQDMSAAAGRRIDVIEAAQGVISVVNANMERALRLISVERGHDPRDFALMPFGGAGGLHAVELARVLRIPQVIVPAAPGALSALGCLASDVVKDVSRTVMLRADDALNAQLAAHFQTMETEARAALKNEGFPARRQRHERLLAVRYVGQSFELDIVWTPRADVAQAFHSAHEARYGYAQPAHSVEVVSLRLRSSGLVAPLPETPLPHSAAQVKPHGYAPVCFAAQATRAAVYERDALPAGATLATPCIVREYSATTLIPRDAQAGVDEYGNLLVKIRQKRTGISRR